MDVLDDDHAKPALCTELTQQGREQIVPRTLHPAQPGQIAAELAAEVQERSERARREQPVARAPAPERVAEPGRELLQQGRLADPGLTAHEHHPAVAPARLIGVVSQRPQRQFPLQQRHSASVGQVRSPTQRRQPAVSWPHVLALISSRCGRHHRRPRGRFGGMVITDVSPAGLPLPGDVVRK